MLVRTVKLTHPVTVGFLAGFGFAVLLVGAGISWGFNIGELLIAFVSAMSGSAIGIFLAWNLLRGLREQR